MSSTSTSKICAATAVTCVSDSGATAYSPQEAAVLAIEAGADIILCACLGTVQSSIRSSLIEAVNTGRLPEERLDTSVRRVVSLKLRHSIGSAEAFDPTKIGSAEHFQVVNDIWEEFNQFSD